MGSKQINVLSLPQPWATLVVRGIKGIIIQPFNTSYRGVVQIHANKVMRCGMRTEERRHFLSSIEQLVPDITTFRNMEFGSIIGEVELTHVLQDLKTNDPEKAMFLNAAGYDLQKEKLIGDYCREGYFWLLSNAVEYANPIKSDKRRTYWSWNDDLSVRG